MFIIEAAFWIVLALILYAYLGFPLLLLLRGLWQCPPQKQAFTPAVSFVVIAHNEAAAIGAKLENVLSLNYPPSKLQVLIGSDGSDDGTDQIVKRYADAGVMLHAFPRSGKIPTLNATVEHATGEVLIFSDANSMYDADAISALTRCFSDPRVGAVAGNQCYTDDGENPASFGERAYWRFDRFLKNMQSRSGSATSSTGAIHAIRRELFQPVPPAVCDDFVISTRAIEQGYRLVFEPEAIAREPVAATDRAEFQRKTRVITRGLRGLWAVRRLFNPLRFGFYSLQLASHKLLRWSVIGLLPILFTLTCILSTARTFYTVFLVLQAAFYAIALFAFLVRSTPLARLPAFKLCKIPYYFCLVNIAAGCGWIQLLRGQKVDRWNNHRSDGPPDQPTLAAGAPSTLAAKR